VDGAGREAPTVSTRTLIVLLRRSRSLCAREELICASSTRFQAIYWARNRCASLVVGAGGTGSAIAMGLPYLDQAMRVWGRSSGLEWL